MVQQSGSHIGPTSSKLLICAVHLGTVCNLNSQVTITMLLLQRRTAGSRRKEHLRHGSIGTVHSFKKLILGAVPRRELAGQLSVLRECMEAWACARACTHPPN